MKAPANNEMYVAQNLKFCSEILFGRVEVIIENEKIMVSTFSLIFPKCFRRLVIRNCVANV